MAGGSLRERLGPGRPLPGDVRGPMERGLGATLGDVRLHEGGAAAGLASALGASAFAYGRDVGLAADAPRAGTFRGRLLLAHELAHAAQQARGPSSAAGPGTGALEADADRAALGAVLGTGGGVRHGSPLSLQLRKCTSSDQDVHDQKLKVMEALQDPTANEAKLIALLDALGDDAEDVIPKAVIFSSQDGIVALARVPAGQRILKKAADALAGSTDIKAAATLKQINETLALRTVPERAATPDEAAKVARIKAAVAAEDPAVKKQYAAVSPPLDLDVKLFQAGHELAGGVYYDPGMPKALPGAAGVTGGVDGSRSVPALGTAPAVELNFAVGDFIRLGPLTLTSTDAAIRSALFHEFNHYRLHMEGARGASDPGAKKLWEMRAANDPGQTPSEETEIVGLQIAHDMGLLNADEMSQSLAYLGMSLASGKVPQEIKDRAYLRITTATAANPAGRKTLLDGFAVLAKSTLPRATVTAIDDLKALLTAQAKPAPKATAKPGKGP